MFVSDQYRCSQKEISILILEFASTNCSRPLTSHTKRKLNAKATSLYWVLGISNLPATPTEIESNVTFHSIRRIDKEGAKLAHLVPSPL